MQQDVPELVSQGLDRLSVVDIVTHPHRPRREVGDAVGGTARTSVQAETVCGNLVGQRAPEAGWCFPPEESGPWLLGERPTSGLEDVPDVRDAETC